jgi:hypothetical protein
MAELRNPAMADISYDPGIRQHDRAGDFALRNSVKSSLKFEKRKAALQRTVEFEVLPRLLMAHHPHVAEPAVPRFSDSAKVLAEIVLGTRPECGSSHVQALLDQGIRLQDIYIFHIEQAACCLRQFWADDERDFAEVTLGLWRLQQLLREFGAVFRQDALSPTGHRALLTLGSCAAHELPYRMFKLVLAGEFFRHDGWDSWIEPDCNGGDIVTLIHNEWFDVLEISIDDEKKQDSLAAQIKKIRHESLNRSLCVAVGGAAAQGNPNLVETLGGDVIAAELTDATARNRYVHDTPKGRHQ